MGHRNIRTRMYIELAQDHVPWWASVKQSIKHLLYVHQIHTRFNNKPIRYWICRQIIQKYTLHMPYQSICHSDKYINTIWGSRSQWPRGLRCRSATARLLRSCVRIPPEAWMFVCCECCVLSGRGLCDDLITLPEESYWLWCVVVCDLETSRMRRPWPSLVRRATEKKLFRISN
jgi:hypothetical protein